MEEKGRFAPSPSGRMHPGNLFSCLLAWLDARAAGGKVVLRIEDLDRARCREEYTRQVAEDLRWLGLDWDEGYQAGGTAGPYLQSQRTEFYEEAFRRLRDQGLVYPCWCSRSQRLAASAPHPGEVRDRGACPCRELTAEERRKRAEERPPAWKAAVPARRIAFSDLFQGPQSFDLEADCGDFVVRRSDGIFGYQLAVTVDDALMGITRVVRGRDLLDSAARQIWLMEALGFRVPRYGHIPLLLAADGRRLSKRERDLDMGILRACRRPEELIGWLGSLAGLCPEGTACTAEELIPAFQSGSVRKADVCIQAEKC